MVCLEKKGASVDWLSLLNVEGVFAVGGLLPNRDVEEAVAPPNMLEVEVGVFMGWEPKLLGLIPAPNKLLLVAPNGLGPEVAPPMLKKPGVVLGGSAMMKAQ